MSLKFRASIYQGLCFFILYVGLRHLVDIYTDLSLFWAISVTFIPVIILSPKFEVKETTEGENLYMMWIFFKHKKQIRK